MYSLLQEVQGTCPLQGDTYTGQERDADGDGYVELGGDGDQDVGDQGGLVRAEDCLDLSVERHQGRTAVAQAQTISIIENTVKESSAGTHAQTLASSLTETSASSVAQSARYAYTSCGKTRSQPAHDFSNDSLTDMDGEDEDEPR